MTQADSEVVLSAQAKVLARKRDAHRQIVLGGILLPLLRTEDRLRHRVDSALRSHFATSKHDRKVFDLDEPVTYLDALVRTSQSETSATPSSGHPLRGQPAGKGLRSAPEPGRSPAKTPFS